MKVKWISIKNMGSNFGVLEKIANIEPRNWSFFKELVNNAQENLYLSASKKDKVMKNLKISEPTYFKRLKWAEENNILVKEMKGVYRFQENWIKLVTLEVSVRGASRKHDSYSKLKDVKI